MTIDFFSHHLVLSCTFSYLQNLCKWLQTLTWAPTENVDVVLRPIQSGSLITNEDVRGGRELLVTTKALIQQLHGAAPWAGLQYLTFPTLSMSLWAEAGLLQPPCAAELWLKFWMSKGPVPISSQHSPLHQTQTCSLSDTPPVTYPTCTARVMFCERRRVKTEGSKCQPANRSGNTCLALRSSCTSAAVAPSLHKHHMLVALLNVDQVLGGSRWCYLEKEASLPCGFTQR